MTIGKDGSRHAGRTREVNQYEPRSRVEEIPSTLSRLSRTRPHTAVEGSWYKSDARPDGVKPCFSWNRTARLGALLYQGWCACLACCEALFLRLAGALPLHSFLATQEIQPFPQTKIARKVRLSKQRVWTINKKLSETFPDPAWETCSAFSLTGIGVWRLCRSAWISCGSRRVTDVYRGTHPHARG